MDGLTDREKQIYNYILDCMKTDGYAPSVRDICNGLQIRSTSTVHQYLRRLDSKGYIRRDIGKSRAVALQNEDEGTSGESTLRVPLLGKVTAGVPITAVQNFDGYVDFPVSMAHGSRQLFAFKVDGESMREVGIMDGDIVVVEGRSYADNGEIVVAMIDDEATVKRYFRENGHIRLQPENSTMQPIIAKNVTVLGKVIANYRFY